MLRRFLPAIAMASLLILGSGERARANLNVTLVGNTPPSAASSTGPVTGNTSDVFNLTSGIFSASGTGFGELAPGNGPAHMDLQSLSVSSTGAGTATLVFSMNNIASPVGLGTITETFSSHIVTGTGTVSILYETKGDNTNTLYDGTQPTAPFQASLTTTSGAAAASASGAFTAGPGNYSLTEVLVLTFSGAGTLSLSSDSSANFSPVPEPSTMVLTGLGALGLVVYGLRRKAQVA
jgi:hypothetical protein